MENKTKEQIRKAIERDIQLGLSANKVAIKTDVSSSYISKIRNRQWDDKHPSESIWNKLGAYYGISENIIPTMNFQSVFNVSADAQLNQKFLAISAYTGSGKTTATKAYCRKYENSYYVLCRNSMGKKDFLKAIQRSIGVRYNGSIYGRIQAISSFLNSSTKPNLILDDAGKLIDSNLRLIQEVYDETEQNTGIVLAGTEYLKKYIDKMAEKGKLGFEELQDRVGYWQGLDRPTFQEIEYICQTHGMTDPEAFNAVYTLTNTFRQVDRLIKNVKTAAKKNSIPVENIGARLVDDTGFGGNRKAA